MNLEQKLRAAKPTSEPPPFLHARIMNSIKAPEVAKSRACGRVRRFYAALAFVTTLVVILSFIPRAQKPREVAIEIPQIPKVTIPPSASLQKEMEALKADTRNAAYALASSFWPTEK